MNILNSNTTHCDEQLKAEIFRIATKLRGYKLCDCCQLINDYLKETVTALDFTEKAPCSSSYDALILKKANSYGYISAFESILRELGIPEEFFSSVKYVFNYNGKKHEFFCLLIRYVESGSNNTINLYFSPYTEKICNQNLINHDIWFRTYTREL